MDEKGRELLMDSRHSHLRDGWSNAAAPSARMDVNGGTAF
jgi:hypothetical protein